MLKTLTAALAAFFIASSASAQATNCAPYALHENGMRAAGSEPVFSGFSAADHIIHVWVNKGKNSWLIMIVYPNGIGCVVDGGIGLLKVIPAGKRL